MKLYQRFKEIASVNQQFLPDFHENISLIFILRDEFHVGDTIIIPKFILHTIVEV